MDARRLLLLTAVCEHRSLTRAAGGLHLSQPSLSRQIASLERETGMRLLNRSRTGVTPTAAGSSLVRRGQAIRAHLAAAEREVARLRDLEAGELRLAAFPTAAATLALDALIDLREKHPGLAVTVTERGGSEALAAVRGGHADIAVTFAHLDSPPDELLHRELLLEEEMLLALPVGDRRATALSVRLADLADERWILGTSAGVGGFIARACAAAGFEPAVVARLDNQPAIQAAVGAGVGITLIPGLAAGDLRPGVAVTRVAAPTPRRRIYASVLTGPRDAALEAGLATLHAAAQARA